MKTTPITNINSITTVRIAATLTPEQLGELGQLLRDHLSGSASMEDHFFGMAQLVTMGITSKAQAHEIVAQAACYPTSAQGYARKAA